MERGNKYNQWDIPKCEQSMRITNPWLAMIPRSPGRKAGNTEAFDLVKMLFLPKLIQKSKEIPIKILRFFFNPKILKT